MNKNKFEDIVSGKISSLFVDAIYENKKPYINKSCEVLSKLMKVKNGGGFRPIGQWKNVFDIKYVVLYSTNEDIYWQDVLDEEFGMYTYFGDNQTAGRELHDTNLGGNVILRESFNYAMSDNIYDRKKIPPFFLFEKTETGDIKFSGLLVPGYKGINSKEWLTALWAKRNEGGRFQNYKAIFTVLNTDSGSLNKPNDSYIDLRWLDDLKIGKGYDSVYAPTSWKKFIDSGLYTPLTVSVEKQIRTKNEQLPNSKYKMEMLDIIINYFRDYPYLFEEFAILITTLSDSNIINCQNTRPSKDGGRDGIGEYRILNNLSVGLKTTFALEAKCYSLSNSVGVKETSRLISRIKHREFGVFVTTSYVANQAYEEIVEDNHPIAIISGADIIDILYKNDVTDKDELIKFLISNFHK